MSIPFKQKIRKKEIQFTSKLESSNSKIILEFCNTNHFINKILKKFFEDNLQTSSLWQESKIKLFLSTNLLSTSIYLHKYIYISTDVKKTIYAERRLTT